jgi:hypothetical protein
MQWALDEIRKIQKAARSGKPIFKPRVSFIHCTQESLNPYKSYIVARSHHAYAERLDWA